MNRFHPAQDNDGSARRRLRVIFILMGVALVVIRGRVAEGLAGILGLCEDDMRRLLERDSYFVWLSRHLDAETAENLRQAALPGVYVRREPSRLYPLGRTAAHGPG